MGNREQVASRKYGLPVICRECGAERTQAYRGVDRVVIRCVVCGARQHAYYTDSSRWGEIPPEREDEFVVRRVERDLLALVSPPAQALYEYIRRYVGKHGYMPTWSEMLGGLGWRSPNSLRHHLRQLKKVGLIESDYGEPRGIRLVYVA